MEPSHYSLNYTEPLIIRRNKLNIILILVFALSVLLFFVYAGFIAFFKEAPLIFKLFSPIYILFAVYLLKSIIHPIKKIISHNPEFKITENNLILYDHPNYKSLSFKDMIECELQSGTEGGQFIMLNMKLASSVKSNTSAAQRWYFGIPKGKYKYIFLSLDFAAIEPQYFCDFINERIRVNQ